MAEWKVRVTFLVALLSGASILTTSTATAANQQQVTLTQTPKWNAIFTPAQKEMFMGTNDAVYLEITDIDTSQNDYLFRLKSDNTHLATVDHVIKPDSIDVNTRKWSGNISINAIFMGATKIYVERVVNTASNINELSNKTLDLVIVRRMRVIDHVFVGSVATLVSLLYINFGAALDLNVLRGIVTRPVGPIIGFITQFGLMPVLSYVLGLLIFPNSPELQLGLFFTGCSPAGGASNMWTVILGGNLNLSVLMTTIGNFAAFAMVPLWLFTLGHWLFERAEMVVPYMKITTSAIALILPLAIGLAIQKYLPRTTRVLVRLLKPISVCLILFIIIFAIVTNLYLFQLFSWQIAVAGLALPWLGYLIAWIAAKLLRQNVKDALTIAIETGIQNTGFTIFLLKFSLQQPEADLTTVIPVSVAIMTPFPLLALYIYKRFTERTDMNEVKIDEDKIVDEQSS